MNIFGIGIAELLVILLIMLVVAGPQRMLRWAYIAGIYAGKLRTMWLQAVDVLQKEVDEAGLDVQIPRELPTRQNVSRMVNDLARPYAQELDEVSKEISDPLKAAAKEAQEASRQISNPIKAAAQEAQEAARRAVPDPRSSSAAKPALPADMGTWGSTQSPPDAQSGFGAWSDPQHPGQQRK